MRILEGYRANIVCGKKKTRRRVQRKYAMDSKSVRCWPANRVEPSVGLYYVFIAPVIRYGITYTVPWFDLGYQTRLTVSMVLATSHVFFILEAAYSPAARAVASFSAREERSVIPLTVMMPRGPGILSVR